MDTLRVTVVGKDIFRYAIGLIEESGMPKPDEVRDGMLGNMRTLTYSFTIPENEIITKRKAMMKKLSSDNGAVLMPMYVHGDWMRIFVFRAIRG